MKSLLVLTCLVAVCFAATEAASVDMKALLKLIQQVEKRQRPRPGGGGQRGPGQQGGQRGPGGQGEPRPQSCTTDATCTIPDEVCRNTTCRPSCSLNNAACMFGRNNEHNGTCTNGACIGERPEERPEGSGQGPQQSCTSSAECATGDICRNNTCHHSCSDNNVACRFGRDNELSGTCTDGACIGERPAERPEGEDQGTQQGPPQVGGDQGIQAPQVCETDTNCRTGYSCTWDMEEGAWRQRCLTPCTSPTECPNKNAACSFGFCRRQCNYGASECNSEANYTCNLVFAQNRLRTACLKSCTIITRGNDCSPQEACNAGYCSRECTDSLQCHQNHTCDDGHCKRISTCESPSDCRQDHTCKDGQCTRDCSSSFTCNTGYTCSFDAVGQRWAWNCLKGCSEPAECSEKEDAACFQGYCRNFCDPNVASQCQAGYECDTADGWPRCRARPNKRSSDAQTLLSSLKSLVKKWN